MYAPHRSEMVLNSLQLARALQPTYEVSAILSECTAAHVACQFGCQRVLQHLIGKAPNLLNHASLEGYTPLHMLAMYNQVSQQPLPPAVPPTCPHVPLTLSP